MNLSKEALTPTHKPSRLVKGIASDTSIEIEPEITCFLQARDNDLESGDATVMEEDEEESASANGAGLQQSGRGGQLWLALGGVGVIASAFGLYEYFWPRSFMEDLSDDERNEFEMLKSLRKSPNASRINEGGVGKWLLKKGLVGKGLFLTHIVGRGLSNASLQPDLRLPQIFPATSTSSPLVLISSVTSADSQHASNVTDDAISNEADDDARWHSNAEMAKETVWIDTVVIRDLQFLWGAEKTTNKETYLARPARAAPDWNKSINDDQIEKRVRAVFEHADFPAEFLALARHVITRVETNQKVAEADPYKRPLLFYLSALEVLIETLKLHVKNNEINAIYHFLYSRLIVLRSIGDWLSSQQSADRIELYNQRLRAENDALRSSGKQEQGKDEVDYFLKLKYPYWYSQGVRSTEKIAIRRVGQTDVFSLSEMLDHQHVDVDGELIHGKYYFLMDSSGLAYGWEFRSFFDAINKDGFSQFLQSSEGQGYIKQCANTLFQERLKSPATRLLYLDRKQLIQEIQDSLARTPSLATGSANADLLEALDDLSVTQRHWNVTEAAANVFAYVLLQGLDVQLFSGLDQEKVLSSDFRVRDLDDAGRGQWNTSTLTEVLSHGDPRLSDVLEDYSVVFSPELLDAIAKLRPQMEAFQEAARRELAFISIREELEKRLPSLVSRLLERHTWICEIKKMSGEACNLQNQITVKYKSILFDNVEKNMTMGQVLLGDMQKLDGTYGAGNRRIIALPQNIGTVTTDTFNRYIKFVNNQNMQEDILKELDKFAKLEAFEKLGESAKRKKLEQPEGSAELVELIATKKLFDDYVDYLKSKIPGQHVRTLVIPHTPFLLIIDTKVFRPKGSYKTETYLFSILTGRFDLYDSSFHAANAAQLDCDATVEIAAHYAVGAEAQYDRNFVTENDLSKLFFRVIAHQKYNIDRLFASAHESYSAGALELLSKVGPYVVEVLVQNPILGTVLGTVVSVAPKAAQGLIFTGDREAINDIALRNFVKGIINGFIGTGAAKVSTHLFDDAAKSLHARADVVVDSVVWKFLVGKAGEKGISYSVDNVVDKAMDYFIGQPKEASSTQVFDFKLPLQTTIDLTGSFQLYESLFNPAASAERRSRSHCQSLSQAESLKRDQG